MVEQSAPPDPSCAPIARSHLFLVFLRLGLTCFGGPIAHLAYFHAEFVTRRRWLTEHAYAELVALCMFLPGPASSQVGMGIGLLRAGVPGALAAWLGFTLPSALIMAAFGVTLVRLDPAHAGRWIHGLEVAAVAVVAQALLAMARTLCPDWPRRLLAVAAAFLALALPGAAGQFAVITAGALIGWTLLAAPPGTLEPSSTLPVSRQRTALIALAIFAALLILLPTLAAATHAYPLQLLDSFYRTGASVFGGGHVVLPLLHEIVVPRGWVGEAQFMAGYGAAQAVPGPLFTFAAFLGSVSNGSPNGWLGAALATAAIFLPSLLLIVGVLPFWRSLQALPALRRGLMGINAAVVGLLLAAFCGPVWGSGIRSPADFILAAAALLLMIFARCPPWLVVALVTLFAACTSLVKIN